MLSFRDIGIFQMLRRPAPRLMQKQNIKTYEKFNFLCLLLSYFNGFIGFLQKQEACRTG